jgi:hypothetical protein
MDNFETVVLMYVAVVSIKRRSGWAKISHHGSALFVGTC